jgi:hypothetical protein
MASTPSHPRPTKPREDTAAIAASYLSNDGKSLLSSSLATSFASSSSPPPTARRILDHAPRTNRYSLSIPPLSPRTSPYNDVPSRRRRRSAPGHCLGRCRRREEAAFSHDGGGWVTEGAAAETGEADEENNAAAASDNGGRVAR